MARVDPRLGRIRCLGIWSEPLPNFPRLTESRRWHHDLAPDNILVVRRGNGSRFDCDFKIADLGLAHFQRHLESSQRATDEDRHASNAYCKPFVLASEVPCS